MRILYLIKNAIHGIFGSVKGNIIFFLVLCVSLAPAVFICGMMEQSQFNIRLASYAERNAVWVLEFFEEYASEESIRENIYKICPDADSCEFQSNDEEFVFFEGNKTLTYVSGISTGYLEAEGNILVDGRNPWNTEDYAGQCLVRENSPLIELGAGIGDRIEIGERTYEIAGIIKIPYGYGSVYIPFDSFATGKSGSVQYKVILNGGEELTADDLKRRLTESAEIVIDVNRAEEIDRMYRDSVMANIQKRVDIFSVILVFALLGIIVTSLEKTYEDRYRLGVELACGAAKKQVLAEVIIQNLVIGFAVICVDTFLLEISRVLFRIVTIKVPGLVFLLGLYLVMEIVLGIVAAVCMGIVFHKNTAVSLLNEGHENIC